MTNSLNSFRNRGATMRRMTSLVLLTVVAAVGGCDFLDPTSVTNPNITEDDFLETPQAAETWTRGVERQLATTINQIVMGTEVVSDNVFNNRTLFSKVFDIPQLDATDFDVTNTQQEVHQLRAMADLGINTVVPADPTATDELRAQLHFHRGFASLMAGSYFVGLPAETHGPVVTPASHYAAAAADFAQARALSSDPAVQAAARLAEARAWYQAGNRAEAQAAAAVIMASDPDLLRVVEFDITDGPTNTMQFAIFESGQDEFQPLPRLDFLFPKYSSATAGQQQPIAIVKGEEAFLIVAEAQIAQGDLTGARTTLENLIALVDTRPIATVDDRGQARGRVGGTWIYPNDASIDVQASPSDPARSGLVLTRTAPVQVPSVSGTSVDAAMLAAATTEDELLELLYLMRQEIFVVEGRRMIDLGIRFPVATREAETNPNVGTDSPALQPQLPSFVPLNYGLDSFTYTDGDMLAVITNNMNAIIVANKASAAVLPFH